jgi:hypothetical protein
VTTHDDPATAAALSVDPVRWRERFDDLMGRIGGRFAAAWVTGDEVYGADPGLRADLERRRIGYVLAVAASRQVTTAAGPCQVRKLAAALPAGPGSVTPQAQAPRATATTTGPGRPSTLAGPVTATC